MGAFRIKRGIFAVAFLQVQYREKDFLVRELYVTTISCVCAAILFGLFGAGLALHNTSGNPKEAICHYPGKNECIHLPLGELPDMTFTRISDFLTHSPLSAFGSDLY